MRVDTTGSDLNRNIKQQFIKIVIVSSAVSDIQEKISVFSTNNTSRRTTVAVEELQSSPSWRAPAFNDAGEVNTIANADSEGGLWNPSGENTTA